MKTVGGYTFKFKSASEITREKIIQKTGKAKALVRILKGIEEVEKYDGHLVCTVLVKKENDGIQHRSNGSSFVDVGGKSHCVSRLLYGIYKGDPKITKTRVVSHLCKDPSCYNPYHLSGESRGVCNDRRDCVGCYHVAGSDHLLLACEHNPRCIRVIEVEEGVIDESDYTTMEWSEFDPTPENEHGWYKNK